MIHSHSHHSDSTHSHSHERFGHERTLARKRLLWGLMLTGSMMLVEAAAGFLTGSLALLSESGHMLTHFVALGTSFLASLVAAKKTSSRFSFGLYRVEILSALFNGVTLLGIVAYILFEGIERLLHPQPIAAVSMFWVALVGLGVNLITAWFLHDVGKEDINTRGAFLHMLADTISSFGVVAGAGIIYFTNWVWVDALASILIAGIVSLWAWGLLKDSILVLMQSTPAHIKPDAVNSLLKNSHEKIREVKDIRIWELTSKMHFLTAHIVVEDSMTLADCERLRYAMNDLLHQNFSEIHTTFQFGIANGFKKPHALTKEMSYEA